MINPSSRIQYNHIHKYNSLMASRLKQSNLTGLSNKNKTQEKSL